MFPTLSARVAAFSMTCLTSLAACSAPAPAAVSAPVLITVEMTEGTNMAAALSPDGSALVLALQGVLWSLPAGGGKATPLTPPEMDAHEPVWAPDGSLIAFYAFENDGFTVWTIKPDGSDRKMWTEGVGDARYPSFAGDAGTLIYSSDEDGGYQIWSLNLESGVRSKLTTADETGYEVPVTPYFSGAGNAVYPTLSPDGSMLAFVVDGQMSTLIVRPLTADGSFKVLYTAGTLGAPAWAADGSALYVAGITGESGHLARIALDGSPATRLVSDRDVFPFRPGVTPEGDILFTADGGIEKVSTAGEPAGKIEFSASVTLDRTPYKRRTYDLISQTRRPALGILDPVLSPDGASAAFIALGDLWVADLATEEVRKLTDDADVDLSPAWSPDGASIAFASDRDGVTTLWKMTLEDGALTKLFDAEVPSYSPAWSPDGSKIAFLTDALTTSFLGAVVQVLDVQSGERITISDPIFGPSPPTWSPDGLAVAVVARKPMTSRFREGHNALLLLPASGDGERLWVTPEEDASLGRRQWSRIAWNQSGQIVYRLDGALWSAPLSSSGKIGTAQKVADAGENPSWSADGSKLIYMDGDTVKFHDTGTGSTQALNIKPLWTPYLPDTSFTLRAGSLFDGTSDESVENVDIFVSGGVITSIQPAGQTPPAGILIDASDKFVMPGLIESHTHQSTSLGQALGPVWLSHGITTVRETGDDPYHAVERREASAAGRRPAPRVFTAGPLNEGARISYGVSETVGTADAAADSMRLSDKLELDFYKSYVRQDYTIQKRILELAHASGIPVTSHELYPSVANGIDQIEHLGATSRRGYSLKISQLGHSYQDVTSLIGESGMVITPTISLMTRMGTRQVEPSAAILKAIADKGGKIVAGTDSPFVPFAESLHKEIEIYQLAGLTPAHILRTATSDAAEAMGAGNQIGKVAEGYLADLLILDADPLEDVSHTTQISMVFKAGELVYEKPE